MELSNTREAWLKLHRESLPKQREVCTLGAGAGQVLYSIRAHTVCVATDTSVF